MLLLDSFDEVCIEDRLTGMHEVIRPKQNGQTVDVFRNEDVSSSWRLFNRSLPNKAHLDGDPVVAAEALRAGLVELDAGVRVGVRGVEGGRLVEQEVTLWRAARGR